MILGWATVPFLLPVSLYNLFLGRNEIGILTLAVVTVISINALAIHRERPHPVPLWFFYALLLLTLIYGLYSVGTSAAFWAFPVVFLLMFIIPRQQATFYLAIAVAMLVPASFRFLETDVAVRFSITLSMVSYFGYLLVGVLIDMQSELEDLAISDPLTSAYNRRYMLECIHEAMEEMKRDFGPASLVQLDIDNFKEVNDSLGHEAGDKVLVNLVNLLHEHRRKLDNVFRIGGEEFIVLLRNTDAAGAIRYAERLRRHIESTSLLPDQTITVSLGVAEYQKGEAEDDWFKRADNNLYEAKRNGRNMVYPGAVTDVQAGILSKESA